MRQFLDDNFLLKTDTAIELYHGHAAAMPIYDYHCHLPPQAIAENTQFDNLTQIWLGGDHYKWRGLRANGVPERLVTGEAGDWEKFQAWAETVPDTMGNPLYQWTHLELKKPFGVSGILLGPDTAREIWDRCNSLLQTDEYRVRGIMRQMNVKIVCTTDDPTDTLEHHDAIAADSSFDIKVLPAFRPDKAFKVDSPEILGPWLVKLGEAVGGEIRKFTDLVEALDRRMLFFHDKGCRISDHGINAPFAGTTSEGELDRILEAALGGTAASAEEAEAFGAAVFLELGRMYARRGWTMQIHFGALRNANTRMYKTLGPDTGYDAIGDFEQVGPLVAFLDRLDSTDELPKTIVYVLNARDNDAIAAAVGCFQDGKTKGKMQFGSGWWFNDQRDGMERQMTSLANLGLLARFVGMITDSRSFLSYPRHEYFRRVLCNLLGGWVESGELPRDFELLGYMVRNICYNNAVDYFGIDLG